MAYIDTQIAQTGHLRFAKILFSLTVLMLAWWAGFAWWQLLIMALVAMACLWRDAHHHVPLCALSVKDPDGLWELGVDDDDRQIWRAYLHDARRMDFGMGQALRLSFYVVEPYQRPLCVWVFAQSVPMTTFRKLSALACVGGYKKG